jgi:hypothetical protein
MANCNIRNIPDRAHFMIKNKIPDVKNKFSNWKNISKPFLNLFFDFYL